MAIGVAESWVDELRTLLVERFGADRGGRLFERYAEAFPPWYRDVFAARQAVDGIPALEGFTGDSGPLLTVFPDGDRADGSRLALLWSTRRPALLADVFPVLENLGLRIADHRPFELRPAGRPAVRLEDFQLLPRDAAALTDRSVSGLLAETFAAVWDGSAEDDGFNRLVLRAGMGWREVAVLRAIYAYLRQAGRPFTQAHVQRTLLAHRDVARALVALFRARFDPAADPGDADRAARELDEPLDAVDNLNEDRVLRSARSVVLATVRTNYFQRRADGTAKPYLVCKLDPARLPFLPAPCPLIETFVYSPRVEGLHLRAGRVARGGIRWSDRPEDYRAEVLGLMKAQTVKNAVIVPHGAKGAFVVKRPPAADPAALADEVRDCYATFMRGLLDVTDNRVDGRVVAPPDTRCHDDPDSYLVVAADKGTAAFSDLANEVAAEYGFWLGDAFASGGSTGYDHKAMGITARGAYESLRRHFGELGLDPDRDEFTAAGIGDLSGDVFGNGMLLSRKVKLVAAFDHRHVFLDPDPDPETSWTERRRLFELPRSSWADYDPALLSPGGGVFPRTAKAVPLSPQVRAVLGVAAEQLSAEEVIRAILCAPVDLLFNGGVGTYVKASAERHADVADRANDAVRVDAGELRARVVVEGGNLGLTQRARVEYALSGGRINTDFVDNSAGADTSDREVNLKILLDTALVAGRLDPVRRNTLLAELADDVTRQVLADNYHQAQAISVGEVLGTAVLDRMDQVMRRGEAMGILDRAQVGLPDDEELAERRAAGAGLVRPEIAVLLALSKNVIREMLLDMPLLDDPYLARTIRQYLPPRLTTEFADLAERHPLRRELLATLLSNELHNRAGTGALLRLQQLTTDDNLPVAAVIVARDVLDLPSIWTEIDALDLARHAIEQTRLLTRCRLALEQTALWFLRNRNRFDIAEEVARFRQAMRALASTVHRVLPPGSRPRVDDKIARLTAAGVPEPLAARVTLLDPLCLGMDIAELAWASGRDLTWTAALHFAVSDRLELGWLARRTAETRGESHWTHLAKASIRDDLITLNRRLTAAVLRDADPAADPGPALDAWLAHNAARVQLYRETLASLQQEEQPDTTMLAVAAHELQNLAQIGGGNDTELHGLSRLPRPTGSQK